jgi:CysZ protein
LLLVFVGQTIASPFLDFLSEAIESRVLGVPAQPFSVRRTVATTLLAASDAFWGAILWVSVSVPLFFVGLFLPPVAAVLSFVFSAMLLTQQLVGLSLARQLVSYRARWRVVGQDKAIALGFGSACMLMFIVPGLNLVLFPIAASGGTLLYCDLRAAGRLPGTAKPRPGALAAAS